MNVMYNGLRVRTAPYMDYAHIEISKRSYTKRRRLNKRAKVRPVRLYGAAILISGNDLLCHPKTLAQLLKSI